MAHILVTGANGFIGSHLVRHLLKLKEREKWDEQIVCLVRSTSHLASLKGLDVKLVMGDLRNEESLVEAVRGATYVYHLGAELYTTSRRLFLETNTQGTINLLKAAYQYARTDLKRFLFASSQAAAGPAPNSTPLTENHVPCPPVSWYAESKLEAEKTIRQYANRIPVTIVRFCAVYGEGDPGFYQVFKATELGIHPRFGFKKRYTGMVYVQDLVEGIATAARHPKAAGETYFLANPVNYSVSEVTKTIAKAVGKPFGLPLPIPPFVFRATAMITEFLFLFTRKKPLPTRDKVRDISQIYWLCCPQKANDHFGWEAKTSLLDGAKATHRFYREEDKRRSEMPGEPKAILWLKYFFISLCLGVLIEALAAFGKIYAFQPWSLVFAIVPGFWGITFGSLAMALRTRRFVFQYFPGFFLLFAAELLNNSLHVWKFEGGSLYGITNPFLRAAVLGAVTGFLIPVINAIMKLLYKLQCRVG